MTNVITKCESFHIPADNESGEELKDSHKNNMRPRHEIKFQFVTEQIMTGFVCYF